MVQSVYFDAFGEYAFYYFIPFCEGVVGAGYTVGQVNILTVYAVWLVGVIISS